MQVIVIKIPDSMKRQLDLLRLKKSVNMSAFVRNAVAEALKKAA